MSPYLRQRENRLPKFLIKSVIFVVFWVIAIASIIYAMGFEVDFRHWQIRETGTIYLSSSTGKSGVDIIINDKITAHELPATFSRLKAGWYVVSVSKEGFIPWSKTLEVMPSKVSAEDSILLLKSRIEIREANESEKQLIAQLQNEPLDQTLKIINNELYINDNLVTRFSDDITHALWHPDGQHIVYQVSNEIRIIETDGKNDIRLVQLQNDSPTIFRFLRKGQELLYQDGDKIYVARLYD